MGELPLVACPHCDALHTEVSVLAGETAVCTHCASVLIRGSKLKANDYLALVFGALILFIIANVTPLVSLTLQGRSLHPNLPAALALTWEQGHYFLSIMASLMGLWFPLALLLLKLWALLAIRRKKLSSDFALGMRVLKRLEHWSMVPVVFLSVLVAMVKFASIAKIEFSFGIWAYAALMLVYTATLRVDTHRLWSLAAHEGMVVGQASNGVDVESYVACTDCGLTQSPQTNDTGCERCGSELHKRKVNMHSRALALLIAGLILYIPANVLPIMAISTPLGTSEHTIMGGVVTLWQSGSPDLAIIVFTASVVVPITKFIVLLILLFDPQWRGRVVQRQRTRLYEAVEFIGQWSMLDVFVVVLMGAMANFPGVSQVIAGPAAFSFGLVVVLTMLSTLCFDPRVGWDNRMTALRTSNHSSPSFNRLGKQ